MLLIFKDGFEHGGSKAQPKAEHVPSLRAGGEACRSSEALDEALLLLTVTHNRAVFFGFFGGSYPFLKAFLKGNIGEYKG